MRRGRFGRGRSRGGDNYGRSNRNYRGGRGRRGGRRHERSSAQSGNERERIAVESGHLIFIDQFMLANPQFLEGLARLVDQAPEAKNALVEQYGGSVVELEPGTYKIERDPFAFSIVVHQEGEEVYANDIDRESASQVGSVFVDTRCLAMIDRELLDDAALLEKYQQLWFSGQDKACRDLLRDNGGAVRYGFQRHGDELGIYRLPDQQVVCLWPDVIDQVEAPEAEEGQVTA